MTPKPRDATNLIVFSGLPGTGKSVISRRLAEIIGAIWLRIDSIEQAIRSADLLRGAVDDAGYRAAHAVASDNLRLGQSVVVDCVNPWMRTRDAWREVGLASAACVFETEVVCSDGVEHRRRVETRAMDVIGLRRPTWHEMIARDYQPWTRDRLSIDTARTEVDVSVDRIRAYIGRSVSI